MTSSSHLSEGALAAFLDGTLEGERRTSAEAHLARCAECRAELTQVSRIVASAARPGRRGRPAWWAVGTAAAAALVLLFARPAANDRATSDIERVASERATSLRILLPPEGAEVHPDSVVLRWAGEENATYRVTLTDDSGSRVWETTTSSVEVALRSTTVLRPGRRYYWYVDALRADGRSVTSGLRSFSTIAR